MDRSFRPLSLVASISIALLFVATPGSAAAARSAAPDLREALEEPVERQELCTAAANRPVPPPYCSEASWGKQCGELRRELGRLGERTRPLALPEDAGARGQANFDNSDLLLTQFTGAVAQELLCTDDAGEIDALWRHRDTLAAAVGAYDAGLEWEEARVRNSLAELNHLVRIFREFKVLVERA